MPIDANPQRRDMVIKYKYCNVCGEPFTTAFGIFTCTDCKREEED